MSLPAGRSEKRTPVELAVVLSRSNEKPFREKALTENVSSHGLRAITKQMWRPGTRVMASFNGEAVPGPARVVYCQRLANKKFAVGLAMPAKAQ